MNTSRQAASNVLNPFRNLAVTIQFKPRQKKPMKKICVPITVGFLAMTFLTGCLVIGGGTKSETQKPTVGQQLIDLQKAKDSGAISEAEYYSQKARLLDSK